MYTMDRRTHGDLRWRRQDATFHELAKEFPALIRPRWNARVPELSRQDALDRSWKRHRRTQHRATARRNAARIQVKVTYDTPWVAHRYASICYTNARGETVRRPVRVRFRVRDAYRRHRVE